MEKVAWPTHARKRWVLSAEDPEAGSCGLVIELVPQYNSLWAGAVE